MSDIEKINKKRGRKPKSEIKPKRRGRKPTGKIINCIEYNDTVNDDNLIVHLPIMEKETKKKKDISVKKYDKKIEELENQIKELKKSNIKNENYVIPLDVDFVDIENGKLLQQKKNVACWWCCHTFKNNPCGLPEKYYNGIYYVMGYFCSCRCAMAYNNELCDYKMWERISLLNNLAMEIYGSNYKLKSAPPRQCLKLFGGNLDIDEFRITNGDYRFIVPPMISISQLIEKYNKKEEKIGQKLRLKRSKPLASEKNSIEKLVNIIKI